MINFAFKIRCESQLGTLLCQTAAQEEQEVPGLHQLPQFFCEGGTCHAASTPTTLLSLRSCYQVINIKVIKLFSV